MNYLGMILKIAALLSLIAGIAAPEPRLPLIVLSAGLMTAGIFAGGRTAGPPGGEGEKVSLKDPVTIARVIIGAIAAGFIFFGVLRGGLLQVMNKAIRICMECIGLG